MSVFVKESSGLNAAGSPARSEPTAAEQAMRNYTGLQRRRCANEVRFFTRAPGVFRGLDQESEEKFQRHLINRFQS